MVSFKTKYWFTAWLSIVIDVFWELGKTNIIFERWQMLDLIFRSDRSSLYLVDRYVGVVVSRCHGNCKDGGRATPNIHKYLIAVISCPNFMQNCVSWDLRVTLLLPAGGEVGTLTGPVWPIIPPSEVRISGRRRDWLGGNLLRIPELEQIPKVVPGGSLCCLPGSWLCEN